MLAKKNIPVFAASGDDGASDGAKGNNVDYPASSPNAFGCGGTSIAADGKLEIAWRLWWRGPLQDFQDTHVAGDGLHPPMPMQDSS